MAGPHKSRGFTLVELLVVITIIGMLVSLLLPAVQSAREAGRRNTCSNNIRNCALALNMVESAKRRYPGYVNALNGKRASWVVMILPYLERNDLYRIWQTTPAPGSPPGSSLPPSSYSTDGAQYFSGGNPTGGQNPWAYSNIAVLNCPSKPTIDNTNNPLSFVVNCGSAVTNFDNIPSFAPGVNNQWNEDVNSGVFFNDFHGDSSATQTYLASGGGGGKKVNIDFLNTNDGTSYTLMMTENLNSSSWATDPTSSNTFNPLPLYPMQSDFQIKQQTGFVWFFINGSSSTLVRNNDPLDSTNSNSSAHTAFTINSQSNQPQTAANPGNFYAPNSPLLPTSGADGLGFSRPSSQHPGGAGVMFCDGHYQFVSEDIPYKVFTQMMTPNQQGVITPNVGKTVKQQTGVNAWRYTLSEADYN